jgi:hypothetical protein
MDNQERIIRCIVAKQDLKMWNGKEYIRPDIGEEIELPNKLARMQARDGFVRIIGPKT